MFPFANNNHTYLTEICVYIYNYQFAMFIIFPIKSSRTNLNE